MSDNVNRYLYDGEGRLCAYQNVAVAGNYGPMMGYVYGPDGLRVGKGTITTWTCNPLTAGFAMTASYVLGPGGEQVSEMAVTGTYGNYSSSWRHTNVFADGRLLATYNGTETYFALSDWLGGPHKPLLLVWGTFQGAAGNVLSDGVNRYLYDGEGRLCLDLRVIPPRKN